MAKRERIIRFGKLFFVILSMMFIVSMGSLSAEESSTRSDAQKQEMRRQVNRAIETADKLFAEKKYPQSLRILYDAYAQEKTYHSTDAYSKIYDMARYFVHKEQSSFMQYLRNENISLYERINLLSELQTLASGELFSVRSEKFSKQFAGPLVDIMMSQQLSSEEKLEILRLITEEIGEEYVSSEQKSKMIEDMKSFQKNAIEAFDTRQYIEAFRLLDNAVKIHSMLALGSNESTVSYQYSQFCMRIAFAVESPLLNFFRNPKISLAEKRAFLVELKIFAQQQFPEATQMRFQGQYEGQLIQILRSSQITLRTKFSILSYIEDGFEKGMFD